MHEIVGRCGSAKSIRHIATFPDDLMHVIFSRLEFKDKINAGQVCKQWDRLLKADTDDARHWVVDYNVDTHVLSTAFKATRKLYHTKHSTTMVERCDTVHSPFCHSTGVSSSNCCAKKKQSDRQIYHCFICTYGSLVLNARGIGIWAVVGIKQ
jgi:hypothetical protein